MTTVGIFVVERVWEDGATARYTPAMQWSDAVWFEAALRVAWPAQEFRLVEVPA